MTKLHVVLVSACVVGCTTTFAAAAQSVQTQNEIAQQLASADSTERSNALESARRIERANMSYRLRTALIEALEREANLHRRMVLAERRAEPLPQLDDPELLIRLAEVVGELQDPASIPALAAGLGNGFAIIRPLAEFGEAAIPAVLAIESSPGSGVGAINHALIALRFIAEKTAPRGGLSAKSLNETRTVAARRLSTGEGLATTTLWWAIDLAWAVKDDNLEHSVQDLATDPNVVVAHGITDPELIEQTQRRAADRMAGVPPLPRP